MFSLRWRQARNNHLRTKSGSSPKLDKIHQSSQIQINRSLLYYPFLIVQQHNNLVCPNVVLATKAVGLVISNINMDAPRTWLIVSYDSANQQKQYKDTSHNNNTETIIVRFSINAVHHRWSCTNHEHVVQWIANFLVLPRNSPGCRHDLSYWH